MFFSNFLMVISQILRLIKKIKINEVLFYHVPQLYQISKQSEGVRGKTSKNLLNLHGMTQVHCVIIILHVDVTLTYTFHIKE